MKTDFLASGNHFFLYFSETSVVFCPSIGKKFQENPSFRLVETDLRANNGFHKTRKKL